MPLESAYEGEDVPLVAAFTDDSGSAIAPDSAPTLTLTDNEGTAVVDGTPMTDVTGETGVYEYVWDTATDFGTSGTYDVTVTAEFSAETKIVRQTIRVD